MELIIRFVLDHGVALTAILAAITGASQFVVIRRDKRFEQYHFLVKELENMSGELGYCKQLAVIFELRRFPYYKLVTQRIFNVLEEKWKEDPENAGLLQEMHLTMNHLSGCRLIRWLNIQLLPPQHFRP